MSEITVTINVQRDGQDQEVEVTFDYTPASKGKRDSLCGVPNAGPPLEPDEPENLDLVSSTIELTTAEYERAIDQASDRIQELSESRAQGEG